MDNAKRNKVTLALYIVLALILAAVICMTIFSMASNSKKTKLPSDESNGQVTQSPSDNSNDKVTEKKPETEKTPATDRADQDADLPLDEPDASNVNTPIKMKYTEPVEGCLAKDYNIDVPVYSLTMNDYRVHTGIDILAEAGKPVIAMAEGTVTGVYTDPMMGNCISITHPNGLVSYYMGLSDEKVDGIEEGAPVYCGQVISSIGDSTLVELAEECHLHFEVKDDNGFVNPMNYVTYERASDQSATDYEG